jgi:hypothetical protein
MAVKAAQRSRATSNRSYATMKLGGHLAPGGLANAQTSLRPENGTPPSTPAPVAQCRHQAGLPRVHLSRRASLRLSLPKTSGSDGLAERGMSPETRPRSKGVGVPLLVSSGVTGSSIVVVAGLTVAVRRDRAENARFPTTFGRDHHPRAGGRRRCHVDQRPAFVYGGSGIGRGVEATGGSGWTVGRRSGGSDEMSVRTRSRLVMRPSLASASACCGGAALRPVGR